MLTTALRTLYGYNTWATERILAAAAALTPAQLGEPAPVGQRSVHETLVHMLLVQRRWLSWWDGSLSGAAAYGMTLTTADLPDLPAVQAAWERLVAQTDAFLARLTDDVAARDYVNVLPNGAEWRKPLWQMMLHVANHGTQHRSEIAALLTVAGHSPGDLDLLFYLEATGD